MADAKKDKLQIRNSTVDFLVFTKDAHEDGIEVRVQDHDVWLTQKAIARLFDVDRSVVTKHLKNVYESGELSEDATCANFAQVVLSDNSFSAKIFRRCFGNNTAVNIKQLSDAFLRQPDLVILNANFYAICL